MLERRGGSIYTYNHVVKESKQHYNDGKSHSYKLYLMAASTH